MIVNLTPFDVSNFNSINSIAPFNIAYVEDTLLKCPYCGSSTFSGLKCTKVYTLYEYELKCYFCLYACLLGELAVINLDFRSITCISV